MKAVLKFNLEDTNDRMEHYRCTKSLDMAMFLFDLSNKYRHYSKYDDTLTEEQFKGIEIFWQAIQEMLEEHDLNIDKLSQ